MDPKAYYRTIDGYHELAEGSHERPMVSAELLRSFIPPDAAVLDVGGGTGYNAEFLSIKRENYFCADLSEHGLRLMSEKKRGSGFVADAGCLPCREASVGAVLCSWSLEHFVEPERVLSEFRRVLRPGGRIIIWGPNWDNILRKDFPQFAHKSRIFAESVRLRLFFRMLGNEMHLRRYNPYINAGAAAFVDPDHYISYDTDAGHCVLCQETVRFFRDWKVLYLADFRDMLWFVRTTGPARFIRGMLRPVVPLLRKVPLLRWFVIRFPLIIEKPE